MSDEQTTTQETTQETNDQSQSPKRPDFAKLEESRDQYRERAETVEQKAKRLLAKQAGFDPSKKVTQRLLADYDGDLEDPDAFASFAQEEGLEPQMGTNTSNPAENFAHSQQQTAEQLTSASTAGSPQQSASDKIAEAAKNGNWTEVISLSFTEQQKARQVG